MKRIVSIFVLLTMLLSLLCGCFLIEKPDDSGDQGGVIDDGDKPSGDQPGGNESGGNTEGGENEGGNTDGGDSGDNKPTEPDPDAGKNGIEINKK